MEAATTTNSSINSSNSSTPVALLADSVVLLASSLAVVALPVETTSQVATTRDRTRTKDMEEATTTTTASMAVATSTTATRAKDMAAAVAVDSSATSREAVLVVTSRTTILGDMAIHLVVAALGVLTMALHRRAHTSLLVRDHRATEAHLVLLHQVMAPSLARITHLAAPRTASKATAINREAIPREATAEAHLAVRADMASHKVATVSPRADTEASNLTMDMASSKAAVATAAEVHPTQTGDRMSALMIARTDA